MAVVVRSSGGQQRPTTRSVQAPTDLTWPEDKEAPTTICNPACFLNLRRLKLLDGPPLMLLPFLAIIQRIEVPPDHLGKIKPPQQSCSLQTAESDNWVHTRGHRGGGGLKSRTPKSDFLHFRPSKKIPSSANGHRIWIRLRFQSMWSCTLYLTIFADFFTMSKIIQWNIRSMHSNKEELQFLLQYLTLHASACGRQGWKLIIQKTSPPFISVQEAKLMAHLQHVVSKGKTIFSTSYAPISSRFGIARRIKTLIWTVITFKALNWVFKNCVLRCHVPSVSSAISWSGSCWWLTVFVLINIHIMLSFNCRAKLSQ